MGKIELDEILKLLKKLIEYRGFYSQFDTEIDSISNQVKGSISKNDIMDLDYMYLKQKILELINKIESFKKY